MMYLMLLFRLQTKFSHSKTEQSTKDKGQSTKFTVPTTVFPSSFYFQDRDVLAAPLRTGRSYVCEVSNRLRRSFALRRLSVAGVLREWRCNVPEWDALCRANLSARA